MRLARSLDVRVVVRSAYRRAARLVPGEPVSVAIREAVQTVDRLLVIATVRLELLPVLVGPGGLVTVRLEPVRMD